MASLSDVVSSVVIHAHQPSEVSPSHPENAHASEPSSPRISFQSTHKHAAFPSTPSARTGPPRSISFASLPNSRVIIGSRSYSNTENGIIPRFHDHESRVNGNTEAGTSKFRGALEYEDPDQRVREKEFLERIGRKRDSKVVEESWNLLKWLTDTPKEEKTHSELVDSAAKQSTDPPSVEPQPRIQRSNSASHVKDDKRNVASRWGRIRSFIPSIVAQNPSSFQPGTSVLATSSVSVTDELITGGLSTLMLRLWFDRDEKGHRRVPILLHRLRIRISDSLHPLDGTKAVFRIECEYANGAARWVIYRQLREFISLHGHYALSNAYNRNVNTLPEFPRTSLPYLKFLKKEGRDKGNKVDHAHFTRMQREALENYLIGLIRAVMFHPTLNRLAGFLEISALSIAQAQSGGMQLKAGYLKVESSGNKGAGFGPKAASRGSKRAQKWCAVRESYLVVVEELAELTVYDVFLIDSDFKIERPKRYYRQGLHLLHTGHLDRHSEVDEKANGKGKERLDVPHKKEVDCMSTLGSIRSHVSDVFKRSDQRRSSVEDHPAPLEPDGSDSSSDSSSASSHRATTPMLDPSTNTNPLSDPDEHYETDTDGKQKKIRDTKVSKHTFYIENAQMRLKLYAKNERQMLQWIAALEKVKTTSCYARQNRFDSFAPKRSNVAAQWLVDGRDYFWNLSRAILLAKETIYIHDWWLSPELQMRRPLQGKYRLDKLLQRKAQEGIKIYIILYNEVSSRTTPTDSHYTKQRMTALHGENIMVQRSPSHFQTGTFYWAHHEKICVIDQTIAFTGGLDLCFGRWDTPQHVLVDDPDNETQQLSEQIWTGKDYSNARVMDFHTLHKPDDDMYDRSRVPRMPWHDVGMQVVGQPARDLARHFTERWNYLLRIKNHSRVMPCLLPPPEFRPGELATMGLTGTCELQICRSAGPWSLGTPDRVEHSIQNAYLKAIQLSEHFVYIENQFFITSTVVDDVKIENRIGDALVHRILRAHNEGTPWRCCVVIPALPGFAFPLEHGEASSIRIIMECQRRTIFRGPKSIYGRLRKEGINPDEYISIFSLRNWGKLRGNVLTTEQVYIHGKVCIVDDRLAIIGSANINERSQRGERDSEIAVVIQDTDMIDCTMAGKPFKVGRFAHTLRVRLMREHLGVDVDAMYEDDFATSSSAKATNGTRGCDIGEEQCIQDTGVTRVHSREKGAIKSTGQPRLREMFQAYQIAGDISSTNAERTLCNSENEDLVTTAGDKSLGDECTTFTRDGKQKHGFTSSILPTLEEKTFAEAMPPGSQADHPETKESGNLSGGGEPVQARTENELLYGAPADASRDAATDDQPPHYVSGKNDANGEEKKAPEALRRHLTAKLGSKKWTLLTPTPHVDPYGFEDPIAEEFWKKVWVACAVHNTQIYRKVFHAVPDDLVTTWKQYTEFVAHHERLNKPTTDTNSEPVVRMPSVAGDEGTPNIGKSTESLESPGATDYVILDLQEEGMDRKPSMGNGGSSAYNGEDVKASRQKKAGKTCEPFDRSEREEMEKLLGELRGHLVIYPSRFLEGEDMSNNFLFNTDRLLPLFIYN